jgi:hypothetical protein
VLMHCEVVISGTQSCSLSVRQTIGVYPSARTFRLKGRSREFGRLQRPESVL